MTKNIYADWCSPLCMVRVTLTHHFASGQTTVQSRHMLRRCGGYLCSRALLEYFPACFIRPLDRNLERPVFGRFIRPARYHVNIRLHIGTRHILSHSCRAQASLLIYGCWLVNAPHGWFTFTPVPHLRDATDCTRCPAILDINPDHLSLHINSLWKGDDWHNIRFLLPRSYACNQ